MMYWSYARRFWRVLNGIQLFLKPLVPSMIKTLSLGWVWSVCVRNQQISASHCCRWRCWEKQRGVFKNWWMSLRRELTKGAIPLIILTMVSNVWLSISIYSLSWKCFLSLPRKEHHIQHSQCAKISCNNFILSIHSTPIWACAKNHGWLGWIQFTRKIIMAWLGWSF